MSMKQQRPPVLAAWGAGVDSTAMLVELVSRGEPVDQVLFADTGAEKPETYGFIPLFRRWLEGRGVASEVVRYRPTHFKNWPPYRTLTENLLTNGTLPSIAFGRGTCSLKWKVAPQHAWAKTWPPALAAWARGEKVVKLIGFDCSRADDRRYAEAAKLDDPLYAHRYPLREWGWTRADCAERIARAGLPLPPKSACFFCPASKIWELYWLAAHYPDLLERALILERNALTGRHSRFSEVEFGATWEDLVRSADRFPSSSTTVGLGRSFAWNQWARVNDVVDGSFRVRRNAEDRERFLALADHLQSAGNALDARAT